VGMITAILLLGMSCCSADQPPKPFPYALRPTPLPSPRWPEIVDSRESNREKALRYTSQLDIEQDRYYALEKLRGLKAEAAPAIPRLLCEVEMHIDYIYWRGEPTEDIGWVDEAAATLAAIGEPAVKAIVEVLAGACTEAVGHDLAGRPCRNQDMDSELCDWREGVLLDVLRSQGQDAITVLQRLVDDSRPSVSAAAKRILMEIAQSGGASQQGAESDDRGMSE
jgi:hypothetical protein